MHASIGTAAVVVAVLLATAITALAEGSDRAESSRRHRHGLTRHRRRANSGDANLTSMLGQERQSSHQSGVMGFFNRSRSRSNPTPDASSTQASPISPVSPVSSTVESRDPTPPRNVPVPEVTVTDPKGKKPARKSTTPAPRPHVLEPLEYGTCTLYTAAGQLNCLRRFQHFWIVDQKYIKDSFKQIVINVHRKDGKFDLFLGTDKKYLDMELNKRFTKEETIDDWTTTYVGSFYMTSEKTLELKYEYFDAFDPDRKNQRETFTLSNVSANETVNGSYKTVTKPRLTYTTYVRMVQVRGGTILREVDDPPYTTYHHLPTLRDITSKDDPYPLDEDARCMVCQEEIVDSYQEIVRLDCKHFYHFDCLLQWRNDCPECRMIIDRYPMVDITNKDEAKKSKSSGDISTKSEGSRDSKNLQTAEQRMSGLNLSRRQSGGSSSRRRPQSHRRRSSSRK